MRRPAFTLGTLPRTLADIRTPHRNNWDFVAIKDVRLGGSGPAQIKFEVLNITNTVKSVGPSHALRQREFRSNPHAVAASCA